MTIIEAIDRIDVLKPNSIPIEIKIAWLSELDGMLWQELFETHHLTPPQPRDDDVRHDYIDPLEWRETHRWPAPEEEENAGFKGYDTTTDPTTQLLVQAPYNEIYQHWLACQIDNANAEIYKYQNDRILFNNAYLTYSDWFTRHHMPKVKVKEFRI